MTDSSTALKEILRSLEPSGDWEKRREVLKRLQSLAVSGSNFNFKHPALKEALCKQVADLRSNVAIEATTTVNVFARCLPGDQWRTMADCFLTPLFHNACISTAVVSQSATAVLLEMFERRESCTVASYTELCQQHCKSKHSTLRSTAFDVLHVAVKTHLPVRAREKVTTILAEGVSDAIQHIRSTARAIMVYLENQPSQGGVLTRNNEEKEIEKSVELELELPDSVAQPAAVSRRGPRDRDEPPKSVAPRQGPQETMSSKQDIQKTVPVVTDLRKEKSRVAIPPYDTGISATPGPSLVAKEDVQKKLRSVVWSEKAAGLHLLASVGVTKAEVAPVIKCLTDSNLKVVQAAMFVCYKHCSIFIDEGDQNGLTMLTAALISVASPEKDLRETSQELLRTLSGLPLQTLCPLWGKALSAVVHTKLRPACVAHITQTFSRENLDTKVEHTTIYRTILEPLTPLLRQVQTQKECVACLRVLEAKFPKVLEEYIKTLPTASQREWQRLLQQIGLSRAPPKKDLKKIGPENVMPQHVDPTNESPIVSSANLQRQQSSSAARAFTDRSSLSPRHRSAITVGSITKERLLAYVRGAAMHRSTESNLVGFVSSVTQVLQDNVQGSLYSVGLHALRCALSTQPFPCEILQECLKAMLFVNFSQQLATHGPVDEALTQLCSTQDASRAFEAILNVLRSQDDRGSAKGVAWCFHVLEIWITLTAQKDAGIIRRLLNPIWTQVCANISHEITDVRKNVVKATVALYFAVGLELLPCLTEVTMEKVKLITTYINMRLCKESNAQEIHLDTLMEERGLEPLKAY